MAKGSIRFDNGINVEVAADPSQTAGAKLLNAVNLADGQELSGGGNPNSVEVVEGTLANPIGDIDFNELVSALYVGADQTGEAHATIAADATVLGFGLLQQPVYGFNGTLRSTAGAINEDGSFCNEIYWYMDGEQLALHAYMEQDGVVTDIAAYASQIPTTLTIYWHPMPETEGE